MSRVSTGSTVDRILLTEFPRYPVLKPPSDVLARFEPVAQSYWKEIHCLQEESGKLAEIRDYLLPKLLSGDVVV